MPNFHRKEIISVVKQLKSKMSQEFNVIIERDADGYFVASVPTLKGCHTQAKSLDELMERIREAIVLCLEFEEDLEDSLDNGR